MRLTATGSDKITSLVSDRSERSKKHRKAAMDVENLITLVYSRPAIWDSRDKKHADRDFIARQWENIGSDLNCEGSSKAF